MRSLIFDIQRFSIHDGPGIRTTIFFKGCNLVCPWCQNPESISHKPELAYYPANCVGTMDCVSLCQKQALSYQESLSINRAACYTCHTCTVSCLTEGVKVIGKEYDVEPVMREILRDKSYYDTSGGGVTFSGGEPTLHTDFIHELLIHCKKHQIHTNIETNGYFSWEKFQQILPMLDMIYFDLKIINTALHKQYLSAGNEKILQNIEHLVSAKAPVSFRLPLIPHYTATQDNLSDVLALLKKHKISKIHLLPYHNMGESKAEKINSSLPKLGFKSFTPAEVQSFKTFFEDQNIETICFR